MTLPFPIEETIAAIATAIAAGQGGIAVVRISGPKALTVCESIVSVPGEKLWTSHKVFYGHVMNAEKNEHIDEVLILIMRGPRSFTGEDVVEIHCHGGLIAVQRVLERVLTHPEVRRALPGEFSQRAVLNGRLDLTQAEAISELIGARSRRAAQLAMAGIDGGIQRRITALREALLDQLSELEARVDFEDELPPLDGDEVLKEILKVQSKLYELLDDATRGALVRQGLRVAIIGCPNVGKSSLLNRLSRRERAIVSNIPGTTRDLLESEVLFEGVPITLLDTAGMRPTEDAVEQLGIAKSQEALLTADIVVLLFDLSQGWTEEDAALLAKVPNEIPRLVVGNKADIKSKLTITQQAKKIAAIKPDLIFSALTGEGEEPFIQSLLHICGANETQGLQIALNERQKDLAASAAAALKRTEEVANQQLPWDFWTIDLREAIHSLGEITGIEVTEALLDRIFSRFCIGK
ncbi:tRNA uridine-5-carboxymethylaminomethyl(34) synthesis GTPase MnmE [Prochlorococcus sp. MIT 1307]|uniref:tRNA uridine-5-carboxymethylaminomethyl(34) synthesis GTPase MnmE n=1 Tax=Prochlorococcus sp. MIT 1307 TaxID=3096219 RepID=UPI002A755062|nr:tRNA uridine-5-carboxymethylaminomethyl(34) synthesis GTPase MnmE [Prochlorococcus sp. MIT 1307]